MRVPHQSPTMVPIVMYSQTVKQVQLHHPRAPVCQYWAVAGGPAICPTRDPT